MALTDTAVKKAKPLGKTIKLFDERGLYLEVSPRGGKWWRFKYRFGGKAKLLSLGVYPEVKLKTARERRDEMRRLIAEGVDPSAHRKASKTAHYERSANTFEAIAREWHSTHSPTPDPELNKKRKIWAKSHSKRILELLERDLFPWLGARPIKEITAQEILACARRIEGRNALDTAHRAIQNCGQIMRYAIANGKAERNPAADLRGALPPVDGGHFPAITDPKRVADLLRALDAFQGTFVVQSALKLTPLIFVRPGELRTAVWTDIDLESGEWRFMVTKTKTLHIVPLSAQALKILNELRPLTGSGKFVFPGAWGKDRPMSDAAVLAALRRLGIPKEEMSVHGFRAMARTILDEVLGFPPHLIEHQLAHAVKDPNGRAYNRTAHLPQRRQMMQAWADYLDELKAGGKVVPLKRES